MGVKLKQTSISGMRRKPNRQGDRPIDFFKCRVVIFFVFRFVRVQFSALLGRSLLCEAGMLPTKQGKKSGEVLGAFICTEREFANYFLHLQNKATRVDCDRYRGSSPIF
jgi:hypothetical protein